MSKKLVLRAAAIAAATRARPGRSRQFGLRPRHRVVAGRQAGRLRQAGVPGPDRVRHRQYHQAGRLVAEGPPVRACRRAGEGRLEGGQDDREAGAAGEGRRRHAVRGDHHRHLDGATGRRRTAERLRRVRAVGRQAARGRRLAQLPGGPDLQRRRGGQVGAGRQGRRGQAGAPGADAEARHGRSRRWRPPPTWTIADTLARVLGGAGLLLGLVGLALGLRAGRTRKTTP